MFLGIIRSLKNKIANAYEACTKKGAILPSKKDLGNLASTIESISIPTFKTQTKEVISNGTVTPDEGFDGLSSVSVNIPEKSFKTQEKAVTENGDVLPDNGFDGLSKVTVNVKPVLDIANIDSNGTYVPSDGFDGFSEINVNVPSSVKDTVTYSGILGQYASGAKATGQDGTVYYTVPTISSGSTIGFAFEVPKGKVIKFLGNYATNDDKSMYDYISNKDWNLGEIGTAKPIIGNSIVGGITYTVYTNSNTTGTWAEVDPVFDEVIYNGTLVVNASSKSFGGGMMDEIKVTLKNGDKEVSFNWSDDIPSHLKINYYFD